MAPPWDCEKDAVPWKKSAERNFLYGYDVAESSSDAKKVQNQAPKHKYEDRRLEITWFAFGIRIYIPFFSAQMRSYEIRAFVVI